MPDSAPPTPRQVCITWLHENTACDRDQAEQVVEMAEGASQEFGGDPFDYVKQAALQLSQPGWEGMLRFSKPPKLAANGDHVINLTKMAKACGAATLGQTGVGSVARTAANRRQRRA